MRLSRAAIAASLLCVVLTGLAPADVEAQRRRGRQEPAAEPWAPATAGARLGYDSSANATLAGLQVRIPILRSGRVEVMPSADITFPRGLREYGFTAEAVYVTGGRRGGLYAGGGLAVRNSIFGSSSTDPRETVTGYSLVAGFKSGARGAFGSQLELRWIFLAAADVDPRVITFGVNFPLWGRGSAQR